MFSARDADPPVCSCMQAGWSLLHKHARCVNLAQQEVFFSTRGFISVRGRGDAAERDGDVAQASMGGMKIN